MEALGAGAACSLAGRGTRPSPPVGQGLGLVLRSSSTRGGEAGSLALLRRPSCTGQPLASCPLAPELGLGCLLYEGGVFWGPDLSVFGPS